MTSCSRRHSRGPSAFGTPRAASSRQFLRLGFRLEGLQHRLAVGVGDGQVLAAGWLSRQKVLRVCYGRLPAELLNDVVGSNADHLAAIPPAVRVGGIETRVVAKCILRHPFRGFKGSEFARRPSAVHLAIQDLLRFQAGGSKLLWSPWTSGGCLGPMLCGSLLLHQVNRARAGFEGRYMFRSLATKLDFLHTGRLLCSDDAPGSVDVFQRLLDRLLPFERQEEVCR